MPHLAKVSELAVGDTIAVDVSNLHQQVIMPSGTTINARRRAILKAWDIEGVHASRTQLRSYSLWPGCCTTLAV